MTTVDSQDGIQGIAQKMNRRRSMAPKESSKDAPKTELSAKYKETDIKAKENEITCLKYYKDIGLVATTFKGTIKIFDSINFTQIWKNSNRSRDKKHRSNILTFDISTQLGLMATGGAEGMLVLIDPYAYGVINAVVAH